MNRLVVSTVAAVVAACLALPGAGVASEENKAQKLCTNKLRDVYGVDKFRQVWSERLGNHKFRVHGKVKVHDHKYPFQCKVKNGHVKSYAYSGPNPKARKHDDDDDDNMGTVLAVGAGVAILAALVASQAGGDDDKESSQIQVRKSVLEDDCHDILQYRIRDEHDHTARVTLNSSRLNGYDLSGEASAKYHHGHPHRVTFTCHFDRQGQLRDSSYHLY